MEQLFLYEPKSTVGERFERRGRRRYSLRAQIWADPGGTSLSVPCTVLNVSETGAKISVDLEWKVPDAFFLKIGSTTHRAKVVWRRELEALYIGVSFLTPGALGIF